MKKKFRVWDKKHNKWYDESDKYNETLLMDYDTDDIEINGNNCMTLEWNYDDLIVQQYIEYDDDFDNQIFEGDIIKATTRKGYTIISFIKFFPKYGMYGLSEVPHYYNDKYGDRPLGSSGSSTPYKPYIWNSYRSVEIIGNIFENKDLLNKKK